MMKMSNIEIGMQFVNKEDGTVWTVEKKDSKFKCIEIVNADGKMERRSLSYVNKHLEKVEVIEVEAEEMQEQEQPAEVVEPKQKKERKPRQMKETPARDAFTKWFDEQPEQYGYTKITYEKTGPNFIVLKETNGERTRVRYEFYTGRKELKINMKVVDAEAFELEYREMTKYYLPAIIKLPYDETLKETVTKILKHETE